MLVVNMEAVSGWRLTWSRGHKVKGEGESEWRQST